LEVTTEVARIEDISTVEDWIKVLTCPRCGSVSESTNKRFKFGVFDGVGYYCPDCEKTFNVYYRDRDVSHTIPSGNVEIMVYEDVDDERIPEKELQEEFFVLNEGDLELKEESSEPSPLETMFIDTEGFQGEEFILKETPVPVKSDSESVRDRSQEMKEPEVVAEIVEEQVTVPAHVVDPSSEDIIAAIRKLKEDVGQLSELSSEENLVVDAFSKAFMEVMSPLAKALPVDIRVLPKELGIIKRANIIPEGELVLLHEDGSMTSIDLTSSDKRDLLVQIIGNVMPRFNSFIAERRQNVEKRLSFLTNVTKELQSIANAFA